MSEGDDVDDERIEATPIVERGEDPPPHWPKTPPWPQMTSAVWDALPGYVLDLAWRLRLRDWTIKLQHTPTDESDPENDTAVSAKIRCVYGRKLATLVLCIDFAELPLEDQRHTLVHELLHCHLDWLDSVVKNGIPEIFGKLTEGLLTANLHERIEFTVDALADGFAPLLPMPPWA